jgi:hypothetical protein
MSKFTFINERFDYDEYTGDETNIVSKTTREFRAHHLESILDEMTDFLRGAGYHFDGHLDVVSYESKIDEFDKELDELKEETRSQRVFEHIVKDIQNNPISFKNTDDIFVNLDNMNTSFVSGSNDWDTGAAMPTFRIDDSIDLSGITITTLNTDPVLSEQYSFDFTDHNNSNCEVCGLSKSVMAIHRCYDDNCPIYAVKN